MRKPVRPPQPLDGPRLQELALAYVGRFATSRGKLTAYLARKLRERGWQEGAPPADIAAIVARMAEFGYVDDAAFAEMKARSLTRRGYGARRVASAMTEARIADDDRERADAIIAAERVSAALRFAERRRAGPYAAAPIDDPAQRQRLLAAFLRAGHDFALARAILALAPGDPVDGLMAD